MTHSGISTKQHIRNVLVVILSAVVVGFGTVAWMIYYYGPTGIYVLENILLAPATLKALNYSDIDPSTGRSARYQYDRIDFSYVDVGTRRWTRSDVDMETYAEVYRILKADKSVEDRQASEQLFDRHGIAVLALRVHLYGQAERKGQRTFQEVQFIDEGDDYRVEVH
ncbi:MAG: hypothetical protein KDK78_10330, partial [Chlamydiia bacterium]|nr:hypothetical protein [Chlamydiia bacterium]